MTKEQVIAIAIAVAFQRAEYHSKIAAEAQKHADGLAVGAQASWRLVDKMCHDAGFSQIGARGVAEAVAALIPGMPLSPVKVETR